MSIDKTKSMFAMQYTGTVNPNLLKGTSNEWSEWVESSNYGGRPTFLFSESQSNYQDLCASCEIQIQNLEGDLNNHKLTVTGYDTTPTNLEWHIQMPILTLSKNGTFNSYCVWKIADKTSWSIEMTMKGICLQFGYEDRQVMSCQFRFRRLKLEQGTVATPWCKHVDD